MMKRRNFIKTGGITLAASGIVPAFLQSCMSGEGKGTPSLTDMTSGVEPIGDTEYLARQNKLRLLMRDQGVDGLFIEGGTNLQYFFNVSWWMSERVFGAVIPADHDPVWICPGFEAPRAGELIRFGKDIRSWEEHESPYRLLGDIFKSLSSSNPVIALDPNLRSFVIQGIRKESGVELTDGSFLVNRCRGIKSPKELELMDLANNITKRAYQWAFSQFRSGMDRSDMAALISEGHEKMGVSGGGWPLIGIASAFPHGTSQEPELKDGDVILVDGGCSVEGYRSDVTRTIVYGTPSDKQKKVFDVVKKAQTAAHEAVRPGLPAGELDRIARKVIEDAGYGPEYKYFVHRLGHGIGMDGHEWPYLVKDNPLPLEAGMTFSNEPGIYLYDEFGIRIEDCFAVTEDGGRFLGGMLCHSLGEPFAT